MHNVGVNLSFHVMIFVSIFHILTRDNSLHKTNAREKFVLILKLGRAVVMFWRGENSKSFVAKIKDSLSLFPFLFKTILDILRSK